MVFDRTQKSDSDYNFADDDSDHDEFETLKSPKLAQNMATFKLNLESPETTQQSLAYYKKSAETWTVEQISDEISNLTEELEDIKKSKRFKLESALFKLFFQFCIKFINFGFHCQNRFFL
ncbi:hypothetical protein MHBO_002504 [Bonamia ostreae]|uniref:Uncharacterized protein n=1 Tax=Bonamia ostreae TaxID=126728 RepID=A0ABV2ANJ3_9EUKA